MDERVQEMLDHFEIRKLLSEYCHGVDRRDAVRMASVYARESWDDHGTHKCPGPEFAARITGLMRTGEGVGGSHLLGQTQVAVDGDTAGAETYFFASSVKPDDDGGAVLNQMGGRYVDVLVREDGRWKIRERICVHDWSVSVPITGDWVQRASFVQGRRSGDDPSFAVLGISHSGRPGDG